MDLGGDLRAIIVKEMTPHTREAAELAALPTLDLLAAYGNWSVRFPQVQPRTVHISAELGRFLKRGGEVPRRARSVLREIEQGADLEARLSRDVRVGWASPTGSRTRQRKRLDRFLAAWGIHHLHLDPPSTAPAPRSRRGDDLLYVCFTPAAAYALAVFGHSAFDRDVLLRMAAANWPEGGPLRASTFVTGVSSRFAEAEQVELRKGGVATLFEHDGRVYSGNDMISVMGTSLNAAQWAARQARNLDCATVTLTNTPERIVATLKRRFPTRTIGTAWRLVVVGREFAIEEAVSGAHLGLDEAASYGQPRRR